MNITTAKQKLIRAGAFLGGSIQQSPASSAAGEVASLAAMMDANDPAQSEILSCVFAALDALKLADGAHENARLKVEDAYVKLVKYERPKL